MKLFNDIFDSTNGSAKSLPKNTNPLRCPVTENSLHADFWSQARKCLLENVRFIDRRTLKPVSVPSLRNWASTLGGFQRLRNNLKRLSVKRFSPRNVNQDPLENFFGMIRSHGRRNVNPTSTQFQSSFKSLLINNLTSADTIKGNCQMDQDEVLCSLRNFVEKAGSADDNIEDNEHSFLLFPENKALITRSGINGSRIVNKVFKASNSNDCLECQKNFSNVKRLNQLMHDAHVTLEANMPNLCFKYNIVSNLQIALI